AAPGRALPLRSELQRVRGRGRPPARRRSRAAPGGGSCPAVPSLPARRLRPGALREPMEERRLLLAVALSLLVLTAYQLLFAPPPKPRASPTPAASAVPPLPAPSPSLVPGPRPGPRSPVPAPAVAQVADDKERRL